MNLVELEAGSVNRLNVAASSTRVATMPPRAYAPVKRSFTTICIKKTEPIALPSLDARGRCISRHMARCLRQLGANFAPREDAGIYGNRKDLRSIQTCSQVISARSTLAIGASTGVRAPFFDQTQIFLEFDEPANQRHFFCASRIHEQKLRYSDIVNGLAHREARPRGKTGRSATMNSAASRASASPE